MRFLKAPQLSDHCFGKYFTQNPLKTSWLHAKRGIFGSPKLGTFSKKTVVWPWRKAIPEDSKSSMPVRYADD